MQTLNKSKSFKKKILIGVYAFLIIGIIITGASYAEYKQEAEVTFIRARVGDFKVYLTDITATSTNNKIDLSYTSSGLNATTTCAFGTVAGTYNIVADSVDNNKCTKAGLSPNTPYYYKVCAKNNLKQEACKEGNITTKMDPPVLSEVTATSTTNSIKLTYTVSGGKMVDYACYYGTSKDSLTNLGGMLFTECNIGGLKEGTTYYYRVDVSNNGGLSRREGSITTKKAKLYDVVKVGDYVNMTPTSTSYKISKDLTGYTIDQTINPSELHLWRVIRKNSSGTIEMISANVSSNSIRFKNKVGYLNFVEALNQIAAQYTDGKNVISSRHVGYYWQTTKIEPSKFLWSGEFPWEKSTSSGDKWEDCNSEKYLCNTEEKSGGGDVYHVLDRNLIMSTLGTMKATNNIGYYRSYWIASRYYEHPFGSVSMFCGRYVWTDGSLGKYSFYTINGSSSGGDPEHGVRPIIKVKSGAEVQTGGNGTVAAPYVLT